MRIGLRIIKTCISIWLCAMTSILILVIARQFDSSYEWTKVNNQLYNPFFAGLATANAILKDKKTSINQAKIRGIGSIIGGIYAIVIVVIFSFTIDKWLPGVKNTSGGYDYSVLNYTIKYTVFAILVIFLIKFIVHIKKPDMVFIAILTYIAVVVSGQNALYGFVRIFSTLWGVFISLLVNLATLPRFKNKDKLFIVGLDGFTYDDGRGMPSYPLLKINNLIENGANVVFYSSRTPGLFKSITSYLNVNNPVILFNGAGLYDYSYYDYIFEEYLTNESSLYIKEYFENNNINYFENVINDDLLYLFNNKVETEAEKKYYLARKNAICTSYVHGKNIYDKTTSYVVILNDDEINKIINDLKGSKIINDISFSKYPYYECEGYSILKIYSKEADNLNCLNVLSDYIEYKEIIALGCEGIDEPIFNKATKSYICDTTRLNKYNKEINISYHKSIEKKFIEFIKEYNKR